MYENTDTNSSPSQNNDYDNTSMSDYLQRASKACASGDAVLGMHLYLAAFEKGSHGMYAPDDDAVAGLHKAWDVACRLKERSLAEYIFEKLEPFLPPEEVTSCAEQLQRLALDKLEEFGLSREDLEDMTDMISQDFLGIDGSHLMKVQHVTLPHTGSKSRNRSSVDGIALNMADIQKDEVEPKGIQKQHINTTSSQEGGLIDSLSPMGKGKDEETSSVSGGFASDYEHIKYADLAGYRSTISLMRDFGVGRQNDPEFQNLVTLLNARHGLGRMPAADTLVFRSPAREDANRFMGATLGELGLPAIRMRMDENIQGLPVLCVMAQADYQPRLNSLRTMFEGPGVLVLEDLDLWASPFADPGEEIGGFMMGSLSRGAREAISLIRSAVESPDVFVLCSVADDGELDSLFYDLLEPLSIVDIMHPTTTEREDIWMEIARDHPSLRGIDRDELVRYSARMARCDMYMAAREAIEQAYKESLVAGRYVPIGCENLFEKLAAYQPLDSAEYHLLEDAVIHDFKRDLEHVDDLLKGTEE